MIRGRCSPGGGGKFHLLYKQWKKRTATAKKCNAKQKTIPTGSGR